MTTTRENGSLYTRTENGVAFVEFGHPAGNSLPSELLGRLEREFEKLSQDNAVKVIVLRSEGDRAFCAGASFDELLSIGDPEQGKIFFSGFAGVLNAMRICKKLIIGRIQGKVVGGGVGLAAACDYCMATEQSALRLSELSIGIGPFVIAPAVQRKMGVGALAELTLAPEEWKNAYWAKEKGLYARVFENIRELDEQTAVFAGRLSGYNPLALEQMKKCLWQGTEHWNELLPQRAAISGELVLSGFTEKALSKFRK